MVPVEGIEPTLCCQNRILSPTRLPVPPHRLRFVVACGAGRKGRPSGGTATTTGREYREGSSDWQSDIADRTTSSPTGAWGTSGHVDQTPSGTTQGAATGQIIATSISGSTRTMARSPPAPSANPTSSNVTFASSPDISRITCCLSAGRSRSGTLRCSVTSAQEPPSMYSKRIPADAAAPAHENCDRGSPSERCHCSLGSDRTKSARK